MAVGFSRWMISRWLSTLLKPFLIAAAPRLRIPEKYARPAMKQRSMVQVNSTISSRVSPQLVKEISSL